MMEQRKCIVLEEVARNGAEYKAIIKNSNGTSFQGEQFSNEIFKTLSEHRMFTRGGRYREFSFTISAGQETDNKWNRRAEVEKQIDLEGLKKEVYDLAEFIENNILKLETTDLGECKYCHFEAFDVLDVVSTRGNTELLAGDNTVQLKVCKKCGGIAIE